MVLFSDTDLLRSIARGNEQALATLYDRYRRVIFGLLLRVLNNRREAEDVLQEVFVQIWQRGADFGELRGEPITSLVALARSLAIDRLRLLGSCSRTVAGATDASRETFEIALPACPDVINAERREVARAWLQELPEEGRRTLLMAYFEGLSQSEIAAQTNAPLDTVKMRMQTGMAKLRENLSLPVVNLENIPEKIIHQSIKTSLSTRFISHHR